MRTSEDLIRTEEELSQEQVLADIRRSLEAPRIPSDVDTQALALGALERYWDERAKGAIDERGKLVDDIALSFKLASRKLAALQGASILETALLIAPLLVAALFVVAFPRLQGVAAKVFHDERSVQLIWIFSAVLVFMLAFAGKWSLETLSRTGQRAWPYTTFSLAGLLLATSWLAPVGLQKHQELELKALKWSVAEDELQKFSRAKIESGSFENTPRETQTISMSNRRTLRLTPRKITPERLEYEAEGEGLPAPVEIKINKHSGALSMVGEDGEKETTSEFYVGTVDKVTDNELTFTVKDEQGKESSLTFALSALATKPTKGQKVFVAVDSKDKTAIDVVTVKADAKLPAENANKSQEHANPGP